MDTPLVPSEIKPGDRARMCAHLEAVANAQLEYALAPNEKAFIPPWPHTYVELTAPGRWAFACAECAAAARTQKISLDEQITISKRVA